MFAAGRIRSRWLLARDLLLPAENEAHEKARKLRAHSDPECNFSKHPDVAKALEEIKAKGQRYFFRKPMAALETDLYHWRTRIVAVMENGDEGGGDSVVGGGEA